MPSNSSPNLKNLFPYLFQSFFFIVVFFNFSNQNEFKCSHPIYCHGEILKTFQEARLFSDSKTFVDMPLLKTPDEIIKLFEAISNKSSQQELISFLKKYFGEIGSEIVEAELSDWKENIKILNSIEDENLKSWIKDLNNKWKNLARTFQHESCGKDCYSSLWVPNAFILAGGRFREYYYWDSYFILEGLLISEMFETAKGMIDNFFYLIQEYGMIPNGGRIYYMNRSQPPLLSLMVYRYYEQTHDLEFLKHSVQYLEKEYSFWNKYRHVSLEEGLKTNLNNYNAESEEPRPESYSEDLSTANLFETDEEKTRVYRGLASAAESGWDFSSRWLKETTELSSINTANVIPVDLNSILYSVETTLSMIFSLTGNHLKQHFYKHKAIHRHLSIQKYLWNDEQGLWNDYSIKEKKKNTNFYLSNILPLWAGITISSEENIEKLLETISPLINFEGGTPTSLISSGQQWDFPNAWSPLEFFLIKSLEKLNHFKATELANVVASRWINNNFCTWKKTGKMYEKYDVNTLGNPGHGGEYEVQEGFGWTNGVALYLIKNYGHSWKVPEC